MVSKKMGFGLTRLAQMGSNIGLFVVLVQRGRAPRMIGRVGCMTEAEKRG